MRKCLPTCLGLIALTAAAYGATLPPVPMHSGWITFKKVEVHDGFKVFRRYGFMGDADNPFQNLLMFNCAKDVTKAASHITFVLPKNFKPDSFPRSTWLPKMDVRFQINHMQSVSMPGEYHDGELYFDLNTDTKENFTKIMLADTLAVGFGDKNDIVQFEFTDRVDGLFSEYIEEFKRGQLGELTHYSRTGAGSVIDACNAYQQADSASSMAPK